MTRYCSLKSGFLLSKSAGERISSRKVGICGTGFRFLRPPSGSARGLAPQTGTHSRGEARLADQVMPGDGGDALGRAAKGKSGARLELRLDFRLWFSGEAMVESSVRS